MKNVILPVLFFLVVVSVLVFSLVNGANTGSILLVVLPANFFITIGSPQNISYNFSESENYLLGLNVSSSSEVENWKYTLEELPRTRAGNVLGGNIIVENLTFIPNSTIFAKRFSNKLTVFANNSFGQETSDSVVFFVHVNNSAPVLNIQNEVFTCEGTSWENLSLNYLFNSTDKDENDLFFGIEPMQGAYGLFFVENLSQIIVPYSTTTYGKLFSSDLYNGFGIYFLNISVGENDGELPLSDKKSLTVDVIEINSPPVILNQLGVQTIWGIGENRTLYHDYSVIDDESGSDEQGKISFNISSVPALSGLVVDEDGKINFTADISQSGVYDVTVCATDEALPSGNIHQNISEICGQSGANQTICDDFELTITNQNRAPEIVNFYSLNLSFNAGGLQELFFNVSEVDADGTTPDTYWYVDGVLREYDSSSLVDEFAFSFGCGISGTHSVEVVATDGELNDSLSWNVTVEFVVCPLTGGGLVCVANWGCGDWNECKNLEEGFTDGELTNSSFSELKADCELSEYEGVDCGYQKRNCRNLNSCKVGRDKPRIIRSCLYSESPSCFDGIKNCHDGECEFLIDCGGTCDACLTCSDGIQNQGEHGIDCGGPCENDCPLEVPQKFNRDNLYFAFVLLFFLIVLFVIWLFYPFGKRRRKESR